MKSILYSVVIGSLALAFTAGAAQNKNRHAAKARPQHGAATVHTTRPAKVGKSMTAHRNLSAAPSRQRAYAKPRTSAAVNRRSVAAKPSLQRISGKGAAAQRATARDRNVARDNRTTRPMSRTFATAHDRNSSVSRNRNFAANRDRNVAANRTRSVNTRERNVAVNRATRPATADVNRFRKANQFRGRNNVTVNRNRNIGVNPRTNAAYYRGGNVRVTNNWRGNAFSGQRYTVFRNYNRQWHDRSWWTSHYNRIVFVNNGWWYWNAGYWFPAWGYAPSISFVFDGPIYGYNGLTPDQVTVNVQQQLAAAGYYDGPIDGILGSMTREAIANYQADNGLAVTSAIDEPTLATMGLV